MSGLRDGTARWRCARVDCPAHAWQTIHPRGRQDGRQMAEAALVRHWETVHDRQGDDVGQVGMP